MRRRQASAGRRCKLSSNRPDAGSPRLECSEVTRPRHAMSWRGLRSALGMKDVTQFRDRRCGCHKGQLPKALAARERPVPAPSPKACPRRRAVNLRRAVRLLSSSSLPARCGAPLLPQSGQPAAMHLGPGRSIVMPLAHRPESSAGPAAGSARRPRARTRCASLRGSVRNPTPQRTARCKPARADPVESRFDSAPDSVPRRGVRTPTFGKALDLIRSPRRAT